MIADLNQTADLKLSILAPVKFRSQENFSSGRKISRISEHFSGQIVQTK